MTDLTPNPPLAPPIFQVRGQPVVLDSDVARLFGVETRRLNEQVKRNADKFEDDFAFRLSGEEVADLKSQNAISSEGWGGARHRPRVFTEHGVVMAATVLNSSAATAAARFVVRVFVEARRAALAAPPGQNIPVVIDPRAALPIPADMRHGLVAKLNAALGRVLDAIADPVAQTTVRDEARAVALEGLNSIKEHLRKTGFQNEHTLAEVRKLLAEAEAIDVETAGRHIENRHRELALVAKQLRLAIALQQHLETGSVDGLLSVLKDLEGGT